MKFILFSILSIIILTGCEDSLPSRNNIPVDIFTTILTTVDGRTSFQVTRDPAAILTPHPPPVRLQFLVINTFDETFQAPSGIINGSLDLWIAGDENQAGKTYVLTENSEFPPIGSPGLIQNNFLTIDPGDTFFIEIAWPHEVEGTTKVWDYFNMGNGSIRLVNLNVLVNIQLFEELPPLLSEILQLNLTYVKNS